MLQGEQRRGRAAAGADLRVDVLDVVFGGPSRDVEVLGDLAVAQAPGHGAQHLDLAFAESGWGIAPEVQRGVAGPLENGRRGIGVEPPGLNLALDEPGHLARGPCRSMGTRLTERLDHVGRREDPRGQRLVSRPGGSVVAGCVEPLVMAAGQAGHRGEHGRAGEDALRVVGMEPDLFPGRGTERPGAFPDPGRDAHASDVVQQCRGLQRGHRDRIEPQAQRRVGRHPGDTGRVAQRER